MPHGFCTFLRICFQAFDHTIDGAYQLRLFFAQAVDIKDTVGAGGRQIAPAGIVGEVFCGLLQVSYVEDFVVVFDIDNLDDEFTSDRKCKS